MKTQILHPEQCQSLLISPPVGLQLTGKEWTVTPTTKYQALALLQDPVM